MKIFVDIETIPDQAPGALEAIRATIRAPGNYSKADSIAKWLEENGDTEAEKIWRKTALSGTSGEIVAIGYAFGDDEPVDVLTRSPGQPETSILTEFWDLTASALDDRNGHWAGVEWIGHNISFDTRFLLQRSIIHGIRPTVKVDPNARHGGGLIFDTMQAWAGARETISLDVLCRALGVESPKDGDMDGGKVFDVWRAGDVGKMAAYCTRDVEATRRCWRRLTFWDHPRMESAA